MSDNNTFKTKNGFCHILPEKIVLSSDGAMGNVTQTKADPVISPFSVLYTLIALILLYFAISSFFYNLQFQAMVFFAVAVFLIFEVITSLNVSTAPIITKKQIQRIGFKKGIPWLTRSRFEVIFKNKKGKTKKRLIMLPGSLKEGRVQTEKAIELMEQAGFLPKR